MDGGKEAVVMEGWTKGGREGGGWKILLNAMTSTQNTALLQRSM